MSKKKDAIKNYTSSISPSNSIARIQAILAKVGATTINTNFRNGEPVGLSFVLKIESKGEPRELTFVLPARVENVYTILQKVKDSKRRTREQASRTAWKNIHDWVDAQVALIQSEQVTVAEVFLPYLRLPDGNSLFESIANGTTPLLE